MGDEARTAGTWTGKVLVIDDDADQAGLVLLKLRSVGHQVTHLDSGRAGIEAARDLQPDVILLDVSMPEMDGYETCRRLRSDPRTAATSIIMLTFKAMTADKILALTAGADDHIAKPFEPEELAARVAAAIRRTRQMRDVSPLTGLPGNLSISSELERVIHEGTPFALIHVDLDHFKEFNDRYGFDRGDALLIATARLLSQVMDDLPSSPSFIGHIGGDDFVLVVAPAVAEAVAGAVAEGFDRLVPSFYDQAERTLGYIEAKTRRGDDVRLPLASVSMGIATTVHRPFTTRLEATTVAGEMKSLAKKTEGSCWEIDRRGTIPVACPSDDHDR